MAGRTCEMSKYDEIKEAAAARERLFRARHQRCLQYGALMKHNFASYCGIPKGQLRMLRWNGWAAERVFEDAEDGYQFEAAGAMKFDEESQSWRFGLQVKLGVLGWVFCGFGVTDSDGKALVEVARNRPRLVDLNDQNERAQLYEYIVDVIKTCYQEGTPRPAIGFSLPVVETSGTETTLEKAEAPTLPATA